jgi:hypothetical protein
VPPRPTDRRTNAEHAPCEGQQGQRRRLRSSRTRTRAWGTGESGAVAYLLARDRRAAGKEARARVAAIARSPPPAGGSVPFRFLWCVSWADRGESVVCTLYRRGVSLGFQRVAGHY